MTEMIVGAAIGIPLALTFWFGFGYLIYGRWQR